MFWLEFGVDIPTLPRLHAFLRLFYEEEGGCVAWQALRWAGACHKAAKNVHSTEGYLVALLRRYCKHQESTNVPVKCVFTADDLLQLW